MKNPDNPINTRDITNNMMTIIRVIKRVNCEVSSQEKKCFFLVFFLFIISV